MMDEAQVKSQLEFEFEQILNERLSEKDRLMHIGKLKLINKF